VLLVDAEDPDSFEDAKSMIAFFRNMSDVPFVVAANKVPPTDISALRSVRSAIGLDEDSALLPVDARDKDSVKAVLLGLLYRILDSMD
ncbi:MAG: GTP-binding protein, partial [Coriobacteriia bacterium]|nr:GTP-binding protein [Coriobacteriia bacterium]